MNVIEKGALDWHIPLNENFAEIYAKLNGATLFDLKCTGDGEVTATDPAGNATALTQANLDVGSAFEMGKDYNVFVQFSADVAQYIISLQSAMTNFLHIGGFHFGKVRRTRNNGGTVAANTLYLGLEPVNTTGAILGSGWEQAVYNGIVPKSVWTQAHRPICDPRGMTYLGGGAWVDIYQTGVTDMTAAGAITSAFGILPKTGPEDRYNWYDFNRLYGQMGKRMVTLREWLNAAYGSPDGVDANNTNAWTATTNTAKTLTGSVDRAVSAIGCRDCVGNVWEWTDEFAMRLGGDRLAGGTFGSTDGARGGQAIPAATANGNGHHTNITVTSGFMPAGRGAYDAVSPFPQGVGEGGNIYQYFDYSFIAVFAGGNWSSGVNAGARTVHLNNSPWGVSTSIGSRGACDSL